MNRLKIAAMVIISLVLAQAVSAQDQSRLHQILKTGVLRVGTTGDWNPMSIRDPASNTYQGFDIDVMQALAKDMGVTVQFVPTAWATLVNGLVADKYDITTSASITPQRIRTVGFTRSYYQVATVPITLKENLSRFKDWEDINQAGVTVATTLGTSHEQQVKLFFPKAEIKTVEPPARDFQEVLSGRAAVSVTSNIEASRLVVSHPQLAIVPVSAPRRPADLAFIISQDDQVWINFLNHWITIKENQGFFETLQAKWMPMPY
jgi:cyclohexadienyl dehydratase